MYRVFLVGVGVSLAANLAATQAAAEQEQIASQFDAYLNAFNSGDAAAVAAFWSEKATSLNEETGERLTGRSALQSEFEAFFAESPGARLTAQIDEVRVVRPEVAIAEGAATLSIPDAEPTQSAFTAVLVKEDGKWLIESSHERELPSPPTPADALVELDWLVGTWKDQTEGVDVTTTVRWSPNEAFLIRSFNATYADGESFEGTQLIGWDPNNKQYRTWTFLSDGSFGQGEASHSGDRWIIQSSLTMFNGSVYAGTQVITRPDPDTMQIEKIGQSMDGEPLPASGPITVNRVADETTTTQAVGGPQ